MASREEWMKRLGPLYGGAVALAHSTPVRWPGVGNESRSAFWLVALGVPIGIAAWLVAVLARTVGLSQPMAAILGLAAFTVASAAIAERGVVERIDGREASAPSAVAVMVLVFGTGLRIAAIAFLAKGRWFDVFVTTALVGRWAAVFLQALGDPILDDNAPRSLVASPPPAWLTAALSGGVLVVAVFTLGSKGVAVLAIAAAVAFGLGLDAQRRDRGLTSPVVATAAAIAELLVLLVAST